MVGAMVDTHRDQTFLAGGGTKYIDTFLSSTLEGLQPRFRDKLLRI